MKKPWIVCLIVVVCCAYFLVQLTAEEIDTAKRNDIRKLLVMTGAGERGKQMMSYMTDNFKKMMPQVPEKFWDEFDNRIDPNELVELVVPIYDKYLTHEEIKGLIEFYESPLGKKLISVQPDIIRESTLAGEEWGARIGEQIGKELDEAGYKL